MIVANKEGPPCGTEGQEEKEEEVGSVTCLLKDVEAVRAAGRSQPQAKEIVDGKEARMTMTPGAENSEYPSTATEALPVNTSGVADCLVSVSNPLDASEMEGASHLGTEQLSDTRNSGSLKSFPHSPRSVACSVHTTHREKEPTLDNTAPSPPSPHTYKERKLPDCTLDADQYAFYAAWYQWYYHVMRSAKQKAAQATALNQEKGNTEPTLPDSKKGLVSKWLERPARQQVDDQELRRYSHTEGGTEFNIWYGKYLTDRYANKTYHDRETAPYKCIPERDAGYTLADTNTPSNDNYFCIYFARGACALGKNCRYRHSIPTLDDEAHLEWSHDIFGRERFKCHRDDMDGVGSFNSDCKTLFVCGFRVEPTEPDALRHTAELLRKEFEVWGDIEDVRVIPKKHIAFISYAYRVQAEFAKAAMADQNLGPRAPLLVVKWAFHNPRVDRKRRSFGDEGQQWPMVKQAGSAYTEESANLAMTGLQPNNTSGVSDVAAQLYKLMKCRRGGSDEAVDVLSELLHQQCENWEHQLKMLQTRTISSPQLVEKWVVAPAHVEASVSAKGGATYVCVEGGNVPSLAALSSTNSGQTHPFHTTETSFAEESHEDQASVTAACNRIQEILGTVENLEPGAFEVQI